MNTRHLLTGLALATLAWSASAHDYKAGEIAIGHPWARPTVPGQAGGGGFLTLENKGAADRLLSAKSDVAKSTELHEMKMEGDVMKMREVGAIDLPAGQTVALKPGGYHVMFMGLKAPLKVGTSFPMVLKFEKAGEVTVQVNVETGQGGAGHGSGGHEGHGGMKH